MSLLVTSCSQIDPRTQALIELRAEVEKELITLIPGDWIIIGRSQALESAVTVQDARHLSVMATNVSTLRETLDLMESGGRLGPRLWVCRELEQSNLARTPGATRLRTHLKELLMGRTHFSVDERVIAMQLKLLEPHRKVLIIHTDTTLPHSSVGIELDYADSASVPPQVPGSSKPTYHHADINP